MNTSLRLHRRKTWMITSCIAFALHGSTALASEAFEIASFSKDLLQGSPVDAPLAPHFGPWSGALREGQVLPGAQWELSADQALSESAYSPLPADYDVRLSPKQALASSRLEIRLQQGHFDPLLEMAPALPALAGSTQGHAGHDYHLIQFNAPIRAEWRSELDRRGIEVLDYVPDFAYLVRAKPDAMAALQGWSAMRWTGLFQPAHRLSGDLIDAAVLARTGQPGQFLVRAFPGESLDDLLAALQAGGARIEEHGTDHGGGAIVQIEAEESSLRTLAVIRAVAWIERKPQFRPMNSVARSNQFTRKDLVEQQTGYYGTGEMVAVTDTGVSTGNVNTIHADFAGRVRGATWGSGSCGHWAGTNAHGTHVAGSVLGSGARSGSNPGAGQYAGSHAGIAPRADLFVWQTCDDFSGIPMTSPYSTYWSPMYGFNQSLRTNNNSWGSADPSAQGTYNTFARETDRFIRDYPDMVAVFAAGNGGTDDDWDGVSDFTTSSPPSTAKNVISVGASESIRASGGFNPGGACGYWGECWPNNFPAPPLAGDRISNHANGMAAFSGRGPTLSGRLKPDIVAPGTNIISARSEVAPTDTVWGVFNQYYLFEGGTSMASPLVAGGAAIVRQFFRQQFSHNPSASLVKAVLINSASDMSPGQYGVGPAQDVWRRPDIHQGWGRMDLGSAVLFSATRQPTYFEYFPGLQTNQMSESPITIRASGSELRITLVWLDQAGMEATHGALVNDLDLEVVDPSNNTLYGFGGIVGQPRDRYNNFEEVRIASAAAGAYKIRVRGYNVPAGPQSFSMVVTGNLAPDDRIFRNGFE